MIENFPVKIDTVGRIVVPKEVRNINNIKEDTKFLIKDDKEWLVFEKIENTTSIDYFGRVLVPKKLRDRYNITSNNLVLLSASTRGFKLKKNQNEYQELIRKIEFLEDNYDFKIILTNNTRTIYTSKTISEFDIKVLKVSDYLSMLKEKYQKKKIKTKNDEVLDLYIIYNNKNEYLLKIVCTLL